MNKNNLNYIEFEKVISNIDNNKSPPLWKYIVTNFEKIISAHENGISYKKMAESLKVSQRSFSVALKKARTEIEKTELNINKNSNKIKNNGVNNLPPPPGLKQNQNKSGFAEL